MALDSRPTQTGMSVPHNTSTTYGNVAQAFLPVSTFFNKAPSGLLSEFVSRRNRSF